MNNDIGVDVVVENEEGSIDIVSDVLKGDKGDKGDPTATIEINKIITGEAGTEAKIENIGTDVNLKLNITIPRGDKGEQGLEGTKGEKGDKGEMGQQGIEGEKGKDGYTPVKGDDYFTEDEIQEIKDDILLNVDEKIGNIQALPTGGTKGQVLTKQSEEEGDAEWEDIEANEVYIGNVEEAPSSAKIVIEEDDIGESANLGKSEIYVGAGEPVAGEKVWFRKGKNLYDKNKSTDDTALNVATGETFIFEGKTTSGYIEVQANTKYVVSNNGNPLTVNLCMYDIDKNYIQGKVESLITTSSNTKYIRFYHDVSPVGVQLEQNSTATEYEEYIEPLIYIRNSNGEYEKFM